MAGTYNAINAQCPYYVYEDPKRREIKCQGIIPDTFNGQKFRRRSDYEKHIRLYCDGKYWKCEYCCALDGYWQDGE